MKEAGYVDPKLEELQYEDPQEEEVQVEEDQQEHDGGEREVQDNHVEGELQEEEETADDPVVEPHERPWKNHGSYSWRSRRWRWWMEGK